PGGHDREQQDRTERACPGLLEHEHGELDGARSHTAGGRVPQHPIRDRIDAALETGSPLHVLDAIDASREKPDNRDAPRPSPQGVRGGVPVARWMMRATISSEVVFSPGRLGLPSPW